MSVTLLVSDDVGLQFIQEVFQSQFYSQLFKKQEIKELPAIISGYSSYGVEIAE